MTHSRSIAVLGVLAATGFAVAQESATMMIQISQATLNPGESTNVSVWASYTPGVGGAAVWNTLGGTGQPGSVLGFSAALFHLVGSPAGGVIGSWSNLQLGPGATNLGTSAGTIGGFSVNTVMWGTGFGPPIAPAGTANPILLWSGTFTAALNTGMGTVGLGTNVFGGAPAPNKVRVWLDVGAPVAAEDAWDVQNGNGTISIIPAPGAAALLALAGMAGLRRRR